MEKKVKKNREIQKLEDYSEYVEQGMIEVGKDNRMDVEVNVLIKKKSGRMPDSIFVLQQFCSELCIRKDYSRTTFIVLFKFMSLSQYENFLSIDVETLAEDLGLNERSVRRATKQLTDDKIILKVVHPNDKRRIDYFINPQAAWRGKSLNRDKAILKLKKDKMQLDMFSPDIPKRIINA